MEPRHRHYIDPLGDVFANVAKAFVGPKLGVLEGHEVPVNCVVEAEADHCHEVPQNDVVLVLARATTTMKV